MRDLFVSKSNLIDPKSEENFVKALNSFGVHVIPKGYNSWLIIQTDKSAKAVGAHLAQFFDELNILRVAELTNEYIIDHSNIDHSS